jgi:hypothetical protein
VNCILATPQWPDPGSGSISARLRQHDWVLEARTIDRAPGAEDIGPDGRFTILVTLTPDGLRELRRRGKAHLVTTWEKHLCQAGVPVFPGADWRLVESLPSPGRELITDDTRPAWMPVVTDLAVERASASLSCRLWIPHDLRVFRGHFPSAPIVPGVLQLGWAVELGRAHRLSVGRLTGIVTAKFRRLLQPGMCLAAWVAQGPGPGQLQFRYALRDTVVSLGRLQFGDGP